MKIISHNDPVNEAPTPSEIDARLEEMSQGEFVEWMIERKGKATREYFIERWGIDAVIVDDTIDNLAGDEIVTVK